MTDIYQGLIKGCKARDREAFNKLFARIEGHLYSICFKYMGCKEDALDVMQEVYLKIFRSIDQFDENREFTPWLRKVTVNTCLNFRRDTARQSHLSLDCENEYGTSLYEKLSGDDRVLETVIKLSVGAEVRECLNLLPREARMTLVMHYLEGATYQEMAAILEQPLGTIKNSLFRARNLLKKILRENGYGEA